MSDQYQIPKGFITPGSENPDVVGVWNSAPEIQQKGVLEARTPDIESDLVVSAHESLNSVLKAMGNHPILSVEADPINPDSAEILGLNADQRAMRRQLIEVA